MKNEKAGYLCSLLFLRNIAAFLENCPEAAGPKSRLWQSPAGARESTFILTPQRGGGVKVLLRYFLIRK